MIETVLITGASGFLGRYIIEEFLDHTDYNVIGIYNSNRPDQDHRRLTWVQCDLLDYLATEDCVKSADWVIHAAAIVSFDPAQKDSMLDFNINSTKHIVNACLTANIKKLIHVSSISALGSSQLVEIDESIKDNPPENYSPYGISKYKSELEVWRGVAENLSACIINPSLIIGSGDWSKGSPKMISTVADGITYYPTGSTGFVYAKDVAKMISMLLHSDYTADRFLCSGSNLSYQAVMDMVASQLKVSQPSKPIQPIHIRLIGLVNMIKKLLRQNAGNIITRDSLETANHKLSYSNKKSIDDLGFAYSSIESSIAEICEEYLTSS